MRVLEIFIIIFLILLSVQFLLPLTIKRQNKRTLIGVLSIAGIIIFLVHIFVEGLRWQLIPVYIPASLLFVWSVFKLVQKYRSQTGAISEPEKVFLRKKPGFVIFLLSIVLLSTTLYLNLLLPVFQLPLPNGEYAIGTTTFELTDDSRDETFTEIPTDHRRILVKAWYPTDDVNGFTTAPYVDAPHQFGTGIQKSWGFPSIIVSHFSLVKTHSYLDAPISQTKDDYPVLIFSHGYGGIIMQNTILMEELASNGYIVFSISHSYEAAVTSFPDGSVIYEATDKMYSDLANSLQIWANDTVFLVDHLELSNNPNIPSLLYSKMDLTRIGAFGHSFGGTTAEEVVLTDSRIDVGISFDSPHGEKASSLNMTKPFMLFFGPDFGNPEMNDSVYLNSNSTCYGLYVNGTRHHNFADVNLWSPLLRSFGLLGSIDGNRMLQVLSDYVLAFFDKHLRGIDSSLLDGPSTDYPEVLFFSKNL
ncbi:hypothetical protein EU527_03020 [Candidatus Thorarchaeota archaeon]|nr:MAG: hypothetical protein EU527_03020 [Candidatus Thorarchaeota archaeon]